MPSPRSNCAKCNVLCVPYSRGLCRKCHSAEYRAANRAKIREQCRNSRYMTGKVSIPDHIAMRILCNAFGCTLADIDGYQGWLIRAAGLQVLRAKLDSLISANMERYRNDIASRAAEVQTVPNAVSAQAVTDQVQDLHVPILSTETTERIAG